jgi:peptidylprolyl isomerase
VRKIPAALAVVALTTVGLVGCSAPWADACPRTTADPDSALGLVTVTGSFASAPEVDVPSPFHVESTAFTDLERGDGVAISAPTQLVAMDVTVVNGATGEVVAQTAYSGDLSQLFTVDRLLQTFPDFDDALQCATEGSRVLAALAPGGMDAETAVGFGVGEDDSVVVVADLQKVYLPAADGDHVFNSGHGMPTVVRAPDGRPGLIVPDGEPPADLRVQTILRGSGEVVTGDSPVRVHYTGVLWDTKKVFDTSWDAEPASFTLDGVVPGFAEALEGATVGSQILAVIPPDQGYGDTEQGSVPAGSTLVFVIDILGIDQAPTE